MRHNDRDHMQIIEQSFKQKNIQTTYLIAGTPQNYSKDAIEIFFIVIICFIYIYFDFYEMTLFMWICYAIEFVCVCVCLWFVEWDILFRSATAWYRKNLVYFIFLLIFTRIETRNTRNHCKNKKGMKNKEKTI